VAPERSTAGACEPVAGTSGPQISPPDVLDRRNERGLGTNCHPNPVQARGRDLRDDRAIMRCDQCGRSADIHLVRRYEKEDLARMRMARDGLACFDSCRQQVRAADTVREN